LSESKVLRTVEEVGAQVQEQLEAGQPLGEATDWNWSWDAQGQSVAYIQVDATGIGIQGANASKAEGQMIYLGAILNAGDPEAKIPRQARYVTKLHELQPLGDLLRQQAAQVGMDRADRWVAITDGGAGLESFLEVYFPRSQLILDFYHAASYVFELAKAWLEGEEGEIQGHAWCRRLKEEGPSGLLAEWRLLAEQCRGPTQQEVGKKVIGYVEKNQYRMDYPAYLREGLWIGSGAIESGCKHVVNQRLKQSGMRWSPRGAQALSSLRAVLRSTKDQWEALWKQNYFHLPN
jgi:hypothetical protein